MYLEKKGNVQWHVAVIIHYVVKPKEAKVEWAKIEPGSQSLSDTVIEVLALRS